MGALLIQYTQWWTDLSPRNKIAIFNDLKSGNPTNQDISIYKWLTIPNRVRVGMKGSLCAHRVHKGDHMCAVQKMISQRSFEVYLEVSVLDNLPIKRLQQSDSKWLGSTASH